MPVPYLLDERFSAHPAAASSRLRVVYLDHTAALSGGELALLRLIDAAAEFVDPHVILAEPGPLADRLERAGVPTEIASPRANSPTPSSATH